MFQNRNWMLTTDDKIIFDMVTPIIIPENTKAWIHLTPRNDEEVAIYLKNFNIHPLTIEDVMNYHSRVKIELFKSYTLIIFRGIRFQSNTISSRNFNFIIAKNVLITITLEQRNSIYDIFSDWENKKNLLESGPEYIMHKIIDVETDRILPIMYRIEDQADELEEQVFSNSSKGLDINLIFMTRGNLQHIKKVIYQHIEILKSIELKKPTFISPESYVFFRDVMDHSIKIVETADSIKELISSILEVHLTLSSRRTSEVMKILTLMTAIMLPMTLITGVFGMNFRHIPFLDSEFGFVFSMILMFVIGFLLFIYFKWKDWF